MTVEADESGPLNAHRLIELLVRLGVQPNEAIQNAWVQSKALKGLGLEGDALDAALVFAGGEEWVDNGPRAGTMVLTDKGADEGKN